MNLITKISDLLFKRQKALEMLAIFLILTAVGFRFNNEKSEWIWSNYPLIALALAITVIFIAIIWITIEKRKMLAAIEDIRIRSKEKSNELEDRLKELSLKQKEVFNLIIQEKSNKEIISEMVIEHSTLKSHINQIYKKLGIKNRKEAQSLGKTLKKAD